MRHISAINILFCAAILLGGCRKDTAPASSSWTDMGTFCTISAPAVEKEKLQTWTAEAQTIVRNINDALTVYTPDSEVSHLNAQAGKEPVPVSPITREMLNISVTYAKETGGAFDITVGPLVRAWGFNTGNVPETALDEVALTAALDRIGFQHIQVSDTTAFLAHEGTEVDFGGIGKGYAVDVCYEALITNATHGIMINIGGNLRCSGNARPDKPWNVGVRNPFDQDGLLGVLSMTDGMAIATSGNYERFVTIGGERYAHILDPRSGRPVKGMAGVTVLCKSATRADALSTAFFVLGTEAALPILRKYEDVEALFVPDRSPIEIYVTPGFARCFDPLEAYASSVHILE